MSACAPAPLYTVSGSKGSYYYGDIPRDSRGEPVWHLITPATSEKPILSLEDVQALVRTGRQPVVEQGSASDNPLMD